MKLNHDYVRDILLYIEENLDYEDKDSETPYRHKIITDSELMTDDIFKKHNKQELSNALELMIKKDYIEVTDDSNISNGVMYIAKIIGLTWKGHELLDNVRDNTVWNAVKKKAFKFGGVSLSALFNCSKTLVNRLMEDPDAVQKFLQGVDGLCQYFK